MKMSKTAKRLAAAALALALLPALAACGGRKAADRGDQASDTLKGIYAALTDPQSGYSRSKADMLAYYPELEYSETLDADRISLTFKANGNEYFTDGAWDFVAEGDWLTVAIDDENHAGIMNVMYVANAIGAYFGMETELISGYLNGLGALEIENENFSVSEDEAAGTTSYKLNIAGAWDMKELDRMVLSEAVMDAEPLGESYISQSGSIGKIRMLANGNADSYTMLFAEYGGLDDIAYQSIVNMVSLRKPVHWEDFLADFSALQDMESDAYSVDLDPDDETVAEIMGERSDKFRYVLLRFGAEGYGEEELEIFVPDAQTIADAYFRAVAGVPRGTAGASLAAAQSACDVLGFAGLNQLWLADTETLRANMRQAWESLTDEERADFDLNFPELNELLAGCFEDFDEARSRFEDAGVLDAMEELMADDTAQWSWEALSASTWTLGNDG